MIVAHEAEKPEAKRRSFENIIRLARKENEAYCAPLLKPTVNRKTFYVSPRSDQGKSHAFVMFGKRNDKSNQSPTKAIDAATTDSWLYWRVLSPSLWMR